MATSTGSYTLYSGSAAANIAMQSAADKDISNMSNAVDPIVGASSSGLVDFLTNLGIDGLVVKAGHVYMDGISITDISTTILVIITATATLGRAYYDFKDWNDKRRINRMIMRRAEMDKQKPRAEDNKGKNDIEN